MKTPVLFLVFNRSDTVLQVFEAIRRARPPQLYVAADGPRTGVLGEAERCEQVRRIATAVDWPCDVHTLFQHENRGCRFAVTQAIDWFFSHESEGIVLQEDCLPTPDFFRYCEWALNAYRNDKRVWHINGNNFGAPADVFYEKSVSFGALAQIWGWASWTDRWARYQGNPFYLSEEVARRSDNWRIGYSARKIKKLHLLSLKKGRDTWDYQWQMAVLNGGGLCVCPSSNLVTKLGGGESSTRTQGARRSDLPAQDLVRPLTYETPVLNRRLTRWYERGMGLRDWRKLVLALLIRARRKMISFWEMSLARVMYGRRVPIVVASSGRNGSTMLFEAIAEGLVRQRFRVSSRNWVGRYLAYLSRAYLNRLSEIEQLSQPVLKTHALYSRRFAGKARFVFIFGDPLESARSADLVARAKGKIWIDSHLYHLESSGTVWDIYKKDILNYERQLETWMSGFPENVVAVHFDDLWDMQNILAKFIGVRFVLPKRRPRKQKTDDVDYNRQLFDRLKLIEDKARDRVRSTYGMA